MRAVWGRVAAVCVPSRSQTAQTAKERPNPTSSKHSCFSPAAPQHTHTACICHTPDGPTTVACLPHAQGSPLDIEELESYGDVQQTGSKTYDV